MHAVLRIDLQTILAGITFHKFIHAGWAVTCFRARILSQVDLHRYIRIFQRQMDRLVFAVIGI